MEVPAAYKGFSGLPEKAANAVRVPGADAQGNIAIDVDLSYPAHADEQLPLIVLMHGCCSSSKENWEAEGAPAGQRFDAAGERWHYNNAWFASRGYAVLTYTARGFQTSPGRGSTGQTHLDSRSYEINDFQALACAVTALFNQDQSLPDIAPDRVVVTGGSYGGAFSWLAATDPIWTCPPYTGAAGTPMSLAAAAPRYGWTDLAYSLLPTGTQSNESGRLPAVNGCDSSPWKLKGARCPGREPIGISKLTMNRVLFGLGTGRFGPGRTTFTPLIRRMFHCLLGRYPPRGRCSRVLSRALPALMRDSSPYYQNGWFRLIRQSPSLRVPIFDAATLTDALFPALEELRMINRIRRRVPDYPLQAYFGDYHHFTNNKPKVWGDTCGSDSHVCTVADYGGELLPRTLVRTGVTTRLDRFIDYYARPPGAGSVTQPVFGVTAELQVCPRTARSFRVRAGEGGPQYGAPTFGALSKRQLALRMRGRGMTASKVKHNPHAVSGDPVRSNGSRCHVEKRRAGRGVATFESARLRRPRTMLGAARIFVRFRARGNRSAMQLDARLYDVFPSGAAILVDRGARRLRKPEAEHGAVSYQLDGNGWRFGRHHRIRVELAQDDYPYLQRSSARSQAEIGGLRVKLPVLR